MMMVIRKCLTAFLIGVLVGLSCVCFAEADIDISGMSRVALEQLQGETAAALSGYHTDISDEEKESVLSMKKNATQDHFAQQGIGISWPWFGFKYDYARQWDMLTLATHIDYNKNGEEHQDDLYGETFPLNGEYQVVYLVVGDETIIDRRNELPDKLWETKPEHMVDRRAGIDLTVLSEEELISLESEIKNAIKEDHSTSGKKETATKKMVSEAVEEKYGDVSWPWFDYTYTCDWNCYTETMQIDYDDENGDSRTDTVYAEVFFREEEAEIVFLSVGDDVIVDKRDEKTDPDWVLWRNSVAYESAFRLFEEGQYGEAAALFESLNCHLNSGDMALLCREKDNEEKYGQAVTLLEKKKYDEAQEIFLSLGEYSDSADKAQECVDRKNEDRYQRAVMLLENRKYDGARMIFLSLGEYSDSADKAQECVDRKTEDMYQQGVALLENREYDKARGIFLELGEYSDSADKAQECVDRKIEDQYQQGVALLQNGEYEAAYEIFTGLNGYRDSADEANVCTNEPVYREAVALLENREYDKARGIFLELGEYSDSADKAQECVDRKTEDRYQQGVALLESEEFAAAYDVFCELGDYKDSKEKAIACVNEPVYQKAEALLKDKKYDAAHLLFVVLGGYRDSADQARQCVDSKNEERYQLAMTLMEKKDYSGACGIFSVLNGYRDSQSKVEYCRKKIKENKYKRAMQLMEEQNYSAARDIFDSLENYRDSGTQEEECRRLIESIDRRIVIDETEIYVYLKKTIQLKPVAEAVKDTAPKTTKFVYTSSDPAVAKVDANGRVTGSAEGIAYITCSASDNADVWNRVKVHVIVPVSNVTLDQTRLAMIRTTDDAACEAMLTATVLPETAYDKSVTWTSSNEKVVKVDQNGRLTALAAGTATVTVTSNDKTLGTKKAICTVTVTQGVTAVTLDKTEEMLYVGKTLNLKATVLPANAKNKKLVWTSDAPAVAKVDANGRVTGLAEGDACITCAASENADICCRVTIHVIVPVSKVTLDQTKLAMVHMADDEVCEAVLTVTALPETAYDRSVTWTSSNEKAVKVDQNGRLTALAAGTAVITVTANDKTLGTKQAKCTVTVTQGVTGVTLDKTAETVFVGKTMNLKATVLPANATDKKLTWASSAPDVATVTTGGVVKGISEGTAVITATSASGKKASCEVTVKQGPATFVITVQARMAYNNHVGNSWSKDFWLDGVKFSGSKSFTAELGQVISVQGEITEYDKNPDYDYFNLSVEMTKEVFANGYKGEEVLYVEENGGRYSGNCAKWIVTITIKKR